MLADDGNRLVGREVVAVVFEHRQVQSRDQAVGGVAGDQVNLAGLQGAGEQAEVHDSWRGGEVQTVGCGQAAVTVGALHELVAESGTPVGGVGGGLGDGSQVEAARVFAPDFDGEGVVETEGAADCQLEARRIFSLDAGVDVFFAAGRILFEDGGQGGAGVFRVDVDASAEDRLVADVAAGQVETALHREMGLVFDLLGNEFAQDELLGKVLGADDDPILAGGAAGGQENG